MNHDYAHCADFRKDCPVDCFRAKLVRDLVTRGTDHRTWISWAHIRGTEECKRKERDGNETEKSE